MPLHLLLIKPSVEIKAVSDHVWPNHAHHSHFIQAKWEQRLSVCFHLSTVWPGSYITCLVRSLTPIRRQDAPSRSPIWGLYVGHFGFHKTNNMNCRTTLGVLFTLGCLTPPSGYIFVHMIRGTCAAKHCFVTWGLSLVRPSTTNTCGFDTWETCPMAPGPQYTMTHTHTHTYDKLWSTSRSWLHFGLSITSILRRNAQLC